MERRKFLHCSRIFVTKNVLNNHIKNFHQKGSRNFKCDSCEKVFTSSESLKRHIKTLHEGQKITNVILVENSSLNQEI